MAKFGVTTEQLMSTAATMRSQSQSIDQILNTLRRRIPDLTGEWTGQAKQTFVETWDKLTSSLDAARSALTSMAKQIDSVASNYASATQAASRAIQ